MTLKFTDLWAREDDLPALTHRTDRIALRNESRPPVVFVDDDPLGFLAGDKEELEASPLKREVADIRHQVYGIDASDFDESEAVIRELVDDFDADTERTFYYTIAGERAQIGGNGIDDFFDAIENFRAIYKDLDAQLEPAEEYQLEGFPHRGMAVQCLGMVSVDDVWLRFSTWFAENPDGRFYQYTSLWVTTIEQHGPLKAMWLGDRVDHPAVGPPSPVNREVMNARTKAPVGPEPLADVKEHGLIGYGDDYTTGNTGEYISCPNPYYRSDRTKRGQQYQRFKDEGVSRRSVKGLLAIDRLPMRVKGGSRGVDEDRFIKAHVSVTQFGKADGPMSSAVTLLSGKATPVPRENYIENNEGGGVVRVVPDSSNRSILDRLRP